VIEREGEREREKKRERESESESGGKIERGEEREEERKTERERERELMNNKGCLKINWKVDLTKMKKSFFPEWESPPAILTEKFQREISSKPGPVQ